MKHFKQYLVAESVDEAVRLRAEAGSGALFIAGGTTVVPAASRAIEVLVDVSRLGLEGIEVGRDVMKIGAATRLSALVTPEIKSALPMLYRAAHGCATPLIRNMATVGGAISGIFLPSDIGIPLLALGAKVTLQGRERRSEALEDLLPESWPPGHDLILEVEIPLPGKQTGCGFAKFARNEIDIGLVNVAAVARVSESGAVENLRIAVGQSISPPALLKEAVVPGAGESLNGDLVARIAGAVAEKVKAKSDSRASSEYRRHLIEILTARAVADAAREMGASLGD